MPARIRTALVAASLLIATSPALADDDQAAALAAAEATGRAIFEHDRAAAVATDVAMAQRTFKRDRRVRGWLTEARDNGIVVTFIDDTPNALYRVLVSSEGEPSPLLPLPEPEPLTAREAGAAQARTLALASDFPACSRTYNTVVLPDASAEGAWMVYLLPATTKATAVPLGGTHRMDVRDGAIASQRGFTRSCVVLNRGRDTSAMMITHILDPIPTEAHVHWNLWAATPLFVATEAGVWAVEDGRIRAVKGQEGED